MPKKAETTVLTNALVLQDDRFAKEEVGSRIIADLMASGLVEEIIEGRDRADVLIITPARRRSSKDAIQAVIRNTLAQLGV